LAQGGTPSPLDRALATRLAAQGIDRLIAEAEAGRQVCLCAGSSGGDVIFHDLGELSAATEADGWRADDQWWRGLRSILDLMAQPGPAPAEERA
jgi:6-phosphofructokinase 1